MLRTSGLLLVLVALAAACGRRARPEPAPQPPAQDSSTGRILAKPDASIEGLAIDSTHVYFTERTSGYVWSISRVAKTGDAAPEHVARVGTDGCRNLAVDGSNVYCLEPRGVFTVAKTGGAGTFIGPKTDCVRGCAMALDGDVVYVSQANGIVRVPKGGGAATEVAHDDVQPTSIATTPTHVYWLSPLRAAHNAAILRVAKTGGAVETLVDDAGTAGDLTPFFVDAGSAPAPPRWRPRTATGTGAASRTTSERRPRASISATIRSTAARCRARGTPKATEG
jgi:hypothetical protein